MAEPVFIESRRFDVEAVANMFGVEAHMVTNELAPGYWERALMRRVARRRLRARLRRALYKLQDAAAGGRPHL